MDGNYFIKLLEENTNEINTLCKKYRIYLRHDDDNGIVENGNGLIKPITNEEVMGQLQTTIGKAQLLINQKFKQFRDLCHKNLRDKECHPNSNEPIVTEFVTRDDDLAGFWDMVCLQIDDIHKMFSILSELRNNDWQPIEKIEEPKPAKPINHKTPTKKVTVQNVALRKRILIEKQKQQQLKQSSSVNSSEPTTTTITTTTTTKPDANSNDSSDDILKPNKTPSKVEAARQRLLEAKRNAILLKQKREAEEKLNKMQQEALDLENSISISNSLNNTSFTTKPKTVNSQFFDISS